MKKTLFALTILIISVFTSACVNNLAVQELNNKANDFMKKGDYENAISRLKSSIDLAPDIFETQYNLAVAYTENEDYEEAKETFKKAIQLKPDSPDVYYSMAVMYENYAKDLYTGETKAQKEKADDENEDDTKKSSFDSEGKYNPTADELDNVKKYYNESINAYEKYLELAGNSSESSDVRSHLEDLKANLLALETDSN